jgi:HEPN domain-containing protein
MNEPAHLSRGLLRKASSDMVALDAALRAGSFDAACFHAQQAAEKFLKAFLANRRVPFPYTHNLAKLLEICAGLDSAFRSLLDVAAPLTPYGVELRYDDSFWPTMQTANEAQAAAATVRDFVLERLPKDLLEGTG